MVKRYAKNKTHESSEDSSAISPCLPVKLSITLDQPRWFNHDWLWGVILAVSVVLAYQQVWHAGYVWDDDLVVTSNPCIIGPLGLKEIWTTSAADICPLTLTTFWLEHALWGLSPLPFHLVNVLLHAADAIVLWRILRSLNVPGAWLGAALWALHPVEVESVAWIAELKNTESGFFFLLSILFYLRWLKSPELAERTGKEWNYPLTLLFAALAMASKSSTVILPIVLCLCAWWMQGRWHWRNLALLAPVFLMSILSAVVSIWTQTLQVDASAHSGWTRTWLERLVTAGDAIWFYLEKLLWPYPLMTIYPRWQVDASQAISCLPLAAVAIVLFILWFFRTSWSRPYFMAYACFLAALLPVLGLVTMTFSRFSFVADHFQYLASMAPLALLGAGMVQLMLFVSPTRLSLRRSAHAGLVVVFFLLSWTRAQAYKNKATLWIDTLAKNPDCWTAYNNIGDLFLSRGHVDKAIDYFRKALEINPNDELSHNNLGAALSKKGQMDEAMFQYQTALGINPNYPSAHLNLGNVFERKGQLDEAMSEYQKALKTNPYLVEAHNNLGNVYLQKAELAQAIAEFQKALAIDPNLTLGHINLATVLLREGQTNAAISHFQTALKANPRFAEVHNGLGSALMTAGRVDEAIDQFQDYLAINPTDASAYNNLGNAFLQKGEVANAISQFQEALRLKPEYNAAQMNLTKAEKLAKQAAGSAGAK